MSRSSPIGRIFVRFQTNSKYSPDLGIRPSKPFSRRRCTDRWFRDLPKKELQWSTCFQEDLPACSGKIFRSDGEPSIRSASSTRKYLSDIESGVKTLASLRNSF